MNELLGRKVTIYSVAGASDFSDVGTLEKIDGDWVWLRKSERDLFVFNANRIRLVKPFEPF